MDRSCQGATWTTSLPQLRQGKARKASQENNVAVKIKTRYGNCNCMKGYEEGGGMQDADNQIPK